jgi:hypothetical protein
MTLPLCRIMDVNHQNVVEFNTAALHGFGTKKYNGGLRWLGILVFHVAVVDARV